MKRLFTLFSVLFVCAGGVLSAHQTKPIVLTTITPQTFLVERIAHGFVTVETIVPPNANAHLFEPTPKDLAKLKGARLWLRMGEGFENRLVSTLKEHNPTLTVLETWRDLPLITHSHNHSGAKTGCCGSWDRHLWLSPRILKKQMPRIATSLIALCPENTNEIHERLKSFLKELDTLDSNISTLLSKKRGQAIIVAHPSFSYFCQDYGLKQLSIEIEGKDPLPKQLKTLLSKAKKESLPFLFVQPQFSQRGAKQVAEKLSLSLYTIDPYAYDYLRSLEAFAKAIAGE